MKKKQYLGEMLIADKLITWDVLEAAIEEGRRTGKRLGRVLVEQGSLSEGLLAKFLKKQLGINVVDINKDYSLDKAMLETLPLKYCKKKHVAPLAIKDGEILVAMADPMNFTIEEEIRFMADTSVKVVFATEKSIFDFLDGKASSDTGYKNEESALSGATRPNIALPVSHDKSDEQTRGISQVNKKASKELSDDAPVVKLLNTIISEAIRKNVSDIHFETYEDAIKLMYRIDGILYEIPNPPPISMQPALISRIKIISRLDISERRLPQDGRIGLEIMGRKIDLRVSIIPSIYGENAVLRILDKGAVILDINELGLDNNETKLIIDQAKRPHGMFLVAGPTGSGKTTTLYAVLQYVKQFDKKILTIEDPVEYQLGGVTQVQAHPEIGLNFARGLRSFLRHDPDVIMVGEIRDLETAEIAVRAALTGHLVLSTVHTNDSPSAITRFIDMGVPAYLVNATFNMVMSQRLVRRICDNCKTSYKITQKKIKEMGLAGKLSTGTTLYHGEGCSKCNRSGYKGRFAIFEVMRVSDRIRDAVIKNSSLMEIKKTAQTAGMLSMLEQGIKKAKSGMTSIEEVIRIASSEDIDFDELF